MHLSCDRVLFTNKLVSVWESGDLTWQSSGYIHHNEPWLRRAHRATRICQGIVPPRCRHRARLTTHLWDHALLWRIHDSQGDFMRLSFIYWKGLIVKKVYFKLHKWLTAAMNGSWFNSDILKFKILNLQMLFCIVIMLYMFKRFVLSYGKKIALGILTSWKKSSHIDVS